MGPAYTPPEREWSQADLAIAVNRSIGRVEGMLISLNLSNQFLDHTMTPLREALRRLAEPVIPDCEAP